MKFVKFLPEITVAFLVTLNTAPVEQKLHPEIKLYAMNCGTIHFTDFNSFSDTGEYEKKSVDLSDPCFLISHPQGFFLWDTGLSDSLIHKPETMGNIKLSKTISLKDQLEKIGLKPNDIKYVSISHSHFDHTSNLNMFKKSTWILQKSELNYASNKHSSVVLDPKKMTSWKQAKKNIIDGDYDVFGDGTVKILKTPGHTPGHQSLEVKLSHSGVLILSGDEYHQRESFEPLRIPEFNTSRAETMASSDRIKTLLKNTHGRLVVQHDQNDFNSLPKYPDYLN